MTSNQPHRCPDEAVLMGLVSGELSNLFAERVRSHLDRCVACQLAVAEVLRVKARPEATTMLGERPAFGLSVGKILGEYRLDQVLGVGGMAAVWAATRARDGQRFAIKVLRLADPEALRRLLREARLLAVLSHPHVVRVQEVLEVGDGESPAIVMELLTGENLAERKRRVTSFTPGQSVRVLHPILGAVQALHAHGIIHRDIKPSNIFLATADEREVPKLIDLGLARSLSLKHASGSGSPLTGPHTVLGTIRYMAPEQMMADSQVDERADVWALGAVLYELLSGDAPLCVDRIDEAIRELRTNGVARLATRAREVPGRLAELVDRALSVDAAQRPSLAEFEDVVASHELANV